MTVDVAVQVRPMPNPTAPNQHAMKAAANPSLTQTTAILTRKTQHTAMLTDRGIRQSSTPEGRQP